MRSRVFLSISLLAAAAAPAQAETLLVTADRLINPGSERMVEDAAVLIEDGVIVASGPVSSVSAPEGAQTIALGAMTLLPGLIDMHTHLEGPSDKGRGYDRYQYAQDRATIWAVANAKKTLDAGFTTVRNVGGTFGMLSVRDAINEGEIPGPRLFVAGPPVGVTGSHCADDNYLPYDRPTTGEGVADGPWALRAKVRRNIKYGVDLIKTCSTGGVFSRGTVLGAPQSTLEELKAIVDEAHLRGLKVAVHAHGTQGIKNAIEAGADTIEHASILDREAIRMAVRNGTFLSMDIYNTEYTLAKGEELGIPEESMAKEREVGQVQRESFRNAVNAGAKVMLGTDAAIYPHGDNAKQLRVMTEFGMSPMQAIRAATIVPAEALGREGKLGCVTEGCHADLIAVSGNPLEDIQTLETVSFVMKDGEVVKGGQ
ncbi:Xaa-Pro dipeptidase [Parvularcula lutaonensis]|uniref:Amidohydrolase family protein n=1 Tax=Parvularcula lutaonensis TaxID=491923 RepID=A0ABV7M7D8_9PROT|nr:amidohydrolase family protein [Parvularcula lutaonensis]GGY41067.1 Xaa-Pro dipeptidase [Parvularcula lutaonensis]